MAVHFYAEKSVDVFDFAAIPGYFDGVANGALHFGRAGVELFGNFGIESLGYRIDNVGIFHRHFNGFAQKLIAFDVRRNTNGNKNVGYFFVHFGLFRASGDSGAVFQLGYALTKFAERTGFAHIVIRAEIYGFGDELVAAERAQHDNF